MRISLKNDESLCEEKLMMSVMRDNRVYNEY